MGYQPTGGDIEELAKYMTYHSFSFGEGSEAGYGRRTEWESEHLTELAEEYRSENPHMDRGEQWLVQNMERMGRDFNMERQPDGEWREQWAWPSDVPPLIMEAAYRDALMKQTLADMDSESMDREDFRRKGEDEFVEQSKTETENLQKFHERQRARMEDIRKDLAGERLEGWVLNSNNRVLTPVDAPSLPRLQHPAVKDPKVKAAAHKPAGFNEGAEVSGSLPDGVSLRQSGYGKKYGRGS